MALFQLSRNRIRREASGWVARLGGQPSADERDAFRRWREADPRHGEAYDRIVGIWHQAGRLSPASRAGRAADLERRRPAGARLALAASLAAALLISFLVLAPRLVQGPGQEPALLAAAVGEIREVRLADGSALVLDSASRVETRFGKSKRELTLLDGRARFRVAHEARPFVVRAGSSEILATGTLFDVSLIGGRTQVVLIEGSVEVRPTNAAAMPGAKPLRLAPGEKLSLTGTSPPERRTATRGDASWPSLMLEFRQTRLADAASLANRYSKVQLHLEGDRIPALRVSGAFRAGDTAGLAQSLASAFKLRIVRQPDGDLLLAEPEQAAAPAA